MTLIRIHLGAGDGKTDGTSLSERRDADQFDRERSAVAGGSTPTRCLPRARAHTCRDALARERHSVAGASLPVVTAGFP